MIALTGSLELDFFLRDGKCASASTVAAVLASHSTAKKRYVAVADLLSRSVHVWAISIDAAHSHKVGSLSLPQGARPVDLAVHPSGSLIYVRSASPSLCFVHTYSAVLYICPLSRSLCPFHAPSAQLCFVMSPALSEWFYHPPCALLSINA